MLTHLFLVAGAVASIAWTCTETEVFREVREWLKAHCKERPTLWRRKLAYLVTCNYCLAHWVALGFYLFEAQKSVVGYFALVFVATVLLSVFNLLRVLLRGAKGWADRQEAKVLN